MEKYQKPKGAKGECKKWWRQQNLKNNNNNNNKFEIKNLNNNTGLKTNI